MSNHIKLHLTKKDVMKLISGKHVSYNHEKQLKKKTAIPHSIFLTKSQHEKHKHHLLTKHAYRLKFSKKQIHHHMRLGSGFFSDIGNFFSKTLPNGLKSAYNTVKNTVTDKKFQGVFLKGFRPTMRIGSEILGLVQPESKAITGPIRAITGAGMRRRRKAGSLQKLGHRYGSSLVKF